MASLPYNVYSMHDAEIIVVPHMQNALYFLAKSVRTLLAYVNALYVFLGSNLSFNNW